jgi:uncharacterized membrane protein YedE/YeeE
MADGFIATLSAVALVPLITLALGFLIGYLAQRSGFCSIGGMRDLMMFKHTRLFFGYLALIAGAFLGYLLFWVIIPAAFPNFYWSATQTNPLAPIPGAPLKLSIISYIILAIIGGFGMGFLGVLLGGCPLRQVIMGTEGNLKSLFFILGTVVGVIIFYYWIIKLVTVVIP